jgi:chorismate dehydratase
MLRILLAEKFGVTPDFYSHRPELGAMLRAHEAALLIGDSAFGDDGAPHVWDLGAAWKELTGLPFVYAVWTLREGVDRERVAEWLRASLAAGLGHLPDIATAAAGENGLDATSILAYLRDSLHFVLDARDAQGIETFHQLCRRYNLVPMSTGSRTPVAAHR